MADQIADVIRLFILEASFLGGSKRGQAGVATDTLRWLVHDIDGETILVGISDDSKQVLLEGPQTVPGLKTFTPGINVVDGGGFDGGFFGIDGGALAIKNNDGGSGSGINIKLETNTGEIIIRPSQQTVATFNGNLGLVMADDKRITCAPSNSGGTSNAGLKLPPGTAPNTPEDGEMWTTVAGLFVRINGVTIGPLS